MGAHSKPRGYVFAAAAGTRTRVLRLSVPAAAVAALAVTGALVVAAVSGAPLPALLGLPGDQSQTPPDPATGVVTIEPTGLPSTDTQGVTGTAATATQSSPSGAAEQVVSRSPATAAAPATSTAAVTAAAATASEPPGATTRATPTARPQTPPGQTRTATTRP